MPNNTNSKVSDLIYGLERINQIIDLCIDRELYKYVDRILRGGRKCSQFLRKLRDTDGKTSLEEFDFSNISFPILSVGRISMPEFAELFQNSQLFKSEKPPFELKQKGKDFPLLKSWSDLFWAKRVRAELQKYNQADWLDRYEDLTIFLETRMPSRIPPGGVKADFYVTQFSYLMELSAVTHGEASLGYAERARKLVKFLFSCCDDPERGPYDRWIWWNMGTAYQHIDRSQKAVLEFNQVIRKFPKELNRFDAVLEYLVNIVPAYLQRTAINLKLQLGYHALQTLEKEIDTNLIDIKAKYRCKLIGAAVKHLEIRIELHRIEALLQLEMLKEAQERLEKSYSAIFGKAARGNRWKVTDVNLPPIDHHQLGAIATQFVEHAVNWWHQEAGRTAASIRNSQSPDKHQENMAFSFNHITKTIEAFKDYWKWIEGNKEDERIFYSRWAQIIKLGMETACELGKTKRARNGQFTFPKDASSQILKVTIELYLSQSDNLPIVRKNRPKPNLTIELENLRSDDLPDFSNGLSTFYKKMGDILLRPEEEGLSQDLKVLVEKKLKEVNNGEPVDYLKKHHIQLLDALDEYEIEFGENQKIKSLERGNERLFLTADVTKECKGCLEETKCKDEAEANAANSKDCPYYFPGVLACQGRPVEKLDKFLYDEDYQRIMEKAEEDFIKHLETPSQQKPHKEGLHFVGLQRWNSLTPAQGKSVGGGYLIYRTDSKGNVDLGIAIDPGFDFVRNLFRMGFSLRDIDIVIISHAHPDHLWDFETLVQLLGELERKKKITHRLNVIMTLGIYERLRHIIKNPKLRKFINPLVVDIRKEIDQDFFSNISESIHCNFRFKTNIEEDNKISPIHWIPVLPLLGNQEEGEIKIRPTHAYHEDYTGISDSFGFVISIPLDRQDPSKFLRFGYTGDTKWVDKDLYPKENIDVASQYKNCNVLLFHIGSLIDHKKGKTFKEYNEPDKCEGLIRRENHPYLMGTIRFLKKLGYPGNNFIDGIERRNKLILIGEFGEELRGGIRTDIVKRLQGEGFSGWPIVPVDVGFDVLLYDYSKRGNESGGIKFLCALCDEHRPITEIDYFRFGQDEAIFHICKTCKKATPDDVRQNKLRQLYEIGRELKPAMRIEYDVS